MLLHQLSFVDKISKERIGKEIEKISLGPHVNQAIHNLNTIGFYNLVFGKSCDEVTIESNNGKLSEILLDFWYSNPKLFLIFSPLKKEETKYFMLVIMLIHFLHDKKGLDSDHILKNSLKFPSKDAVIVSRLLRITEEIREYVNIDNWERESGGILIRKWGSSPVGDFWKLGLIIGFILDAHSSSDIGKVYHSIDLL